MTAEKRFNDFYERMFSYAFTRAYFITKNKAEAEDVVVNSMLSVWRSWQLFENDSKACAYLKVCVHRRSFTYLRNLKVRQKYYSIITEMMNNTVFEPYHSDYEEHLKKLKAVIPHLCPRYQQLMNMILAGHKDKYIAEVMQTNRVRKLKYNAIQHIKQLLYDTQNT